MTPTPLPAPFRGETIALRNVTGVALSENVYAARSRVATHTHAASFFSLTLSGGYVERHGSRQIEYAIGSVSFHPAHDEHSLRISETDTRCLNIELGEEWSRRVPELTHDADLVTLDRGPLLWLAARACAAFQSPATADIDFENLILEMLGCVNGPGVPDRQDCLSSTTRREPRWLARVEEMIRAEFRASLTVFELARRVGVHPVHLSRTWRLFRGGSIARFLHRLRVDEACRLMSEKDRSLADVALEVGFADQPHFTNVFKSLTGSTPRVFRRLFEAGSVERRRLGGRGVRGAPPLRPNI